MSAASYEHRIAPRQFLTSRIGTFRDTGTGTRDTPEKASRAVFTAPIDRERSRGIYSEREGNDTYVYTFFEPIDARRTFPCFDEPSFKVPWQLTFHVRADHVALGNAPVEREAPEPGGMKRVELAVSRPLPSYLVAFVVGPFELIDGGKAGRIATPIRFVTPRGRAGELGYAREVTPRVVAALEDYFDMPYPYGKLDVAVVPRYWGTMEHPGIVAMGQPLTLIDGAPARVARALERSDQCIARVQRELPALRRLLGVPPAPSPHPRRRGDQAGVTAAGRSQAV